MTLKKLLLMGCLGGALAFTACDKDDDDPIVTEQLNSNDKMFLDNATRGNLAEIQTGQLAATNGSTDSVRMFGQMLVTDHQAAQAALDSIASGQSYDLPDSVNATQAGMYQSLQGLTGASFDSAFVAMQISMHDTAISMYQTYASSGTFSSIKSYANATLPKLQMHRAYADSLNARIPQ